MHGPLASCREFLDVGRLGGDVKIVGTCVGSSKTVMPHSDSDDESCGTRKPVLLRSLVHKGVVGTFNKWAGVSHSDSLFDVVGPSTQVHRRGQHRDLAPCCRGVARARQLRRRPLPQRDDSQCGSRGRFAILKASTCSPCPSGVASRRRVNCAF